MKISTKKKNLTGFYLMGSLYPYVTGGMEIFNYYFLKHQVKEPGNTIYYLGENLLSDFNGNADLNGNFVPLKKWWPTRLFYPIQFFFAVIKLRKVLDYAYLSYAEQSWMISFAQSFTLRLFKIPYIVTIHWGKEPEWNFRYPFLYYFKHAHSVIGVSEPICKAFKKVMPQQDFLYIPPLIPFQLSFKTKYELKKQFGYLDSERILLFVGSLKPMKNPDKILESFRKIGPAFLEEQGLRVIFAGTGPMENKLRELVLKYQLDKYVRMDGLVSREKIPDYYKLADCYIICSEYEGTSVSLLEAMVNKTAIIASDAPGINGMLTHEHNSLLYSTSDTDQLAESIKRIFLDNLLAKRLAENAFTDFIDNYSYDSMMAKYKSVFSSILF